MTGTGRAESSGLEDALDQGYSEFVTYAYSNVWTDGNGVASFSGDGYAYGTIGSL